MAKKRSSLAFPDKADPKGRRAIIRSRDEIDKDEGVLANLKPGDPEFRNSGKPERHRPDRSAYQKVTYRINPQAADAIYEVRRLLRREHQIKASLEEVAEAALIAIYEDLIEKGKASMIVVQISRNLETQNSGNMDFDDSQ